MNKLFLKLDKGGNWPRGRACLIVDVGVELLILKYGDAISNLFAAGESGERIDLEKVRKQLVRNFSIRTVSV